MGGNKPTMTAWKTAAVDTTPIVQTDTDADLFNVLRRLAARYRAKNAKLAQDPTVKKTADYYLQAAQAVERLIPEPEDDFPIIMGAPSDILDDVHSMFPETA